MTIFFFVGFCVFTTFTSVYEKKLFRPTVEREPTKTIWVYYDIGINHASKFAQMCMETMKKMEGWEFVVLNDANILEYINPDLLPRNLWDFKYNSKAKQISDIVRTNVLCEHGGNQSL